MLYRRWLGAGLGWVVGGPAGGLLGFFAGREFDDQLEKTPQKTEDISLTEVQLHLIVIIAHLAGLRKKIDLPYLERCQKLFSEYFGPEDAKQTFSVFNHCLQKEYDLTRSCDFLRIYTPASTSRQLIAFLITFAQRTGEITQAEKVFISRIGRHLSIPEQYTSGLFEPIHPQSNAHQILGVSPSASQAEIRSAYRKLTLQYHPDRNTHRSAAEQKDIAETYRQIKEAFEALYPSGS